MQMKLKRLKKSKTVPRFQFEMLAKNREIQVNYNVVVRNRFEGLQEEEDLNIHWQQISEIITESAEEIIPKKKNKNLNRNGKQQKFWTSCMKEE